MYYIPVISARLNLQLQRNAVFILNIVALSILAYIGYLFLHNTSRGLCFTDESYYLLFASQPRHHLTSVTHFGYITTHLYQWSETNIGLFRSLGMLGLLISGGGFALAFENYRRKQAKQRFNYDYILPITFSVFIYYGVMWSVTPSYNWLNLIGILWVGTGLLLASSQDNAKYQLLVGALLIGVGGTLTFIAKPTSAAILGFIAVGWSLYHRYGIKFIAFSGFIAVAALSLHIWFNFDGYESYYLSLKQGLLLSKQLDAGHSFSQLMFKTRDELGDLIKVVLNLRFFQIILCLLCVHYLILKKTARFYDWISTDKLVLLILFFWGITLFQALPINTFFFFTIGSLFAMLAIRDKTSFAMCLFLFGLSFAYAFGTNNNLLDWMLGSSIFLITAICYLVQSIPSSRLINSVINCLISLTILSISFGGYHHPYRLVGDISQQIYPVSILSSKHVLYVDKSTQQYINALKQLALQSGWKTGTPLIDMTGATPGASVVLNAQVLGSGWLLGGYLGSNDFVESLLRQIPFSVLNKAWILTTPNGDRALDVQLLKRLHLDFPQAYEQIGPLTPGFRQETQILWKPID